MRYLAKGFRTVNFLSIICVAYKSSEYKTEHPVCKADASIMPSKKENP